jgi:uncharacterized protein (TIRG00374 family)
MKPPDLAAEPAPPTSRWSRWLRLVVSLSLLPLLLLYVDVGEVAALVGAADPAFLLLGLLLAILQLVAGAYRWHVLVAGRRPAISLKLLTRIVFVASFLGTFTPGALGIEVLRVWHLARATGDLALAFTSVLVERALGLLALCAMTLFGLAIVPLTLPGGIKEAAWIGLALLALAAAVLMLPRARLATLALLPGRLLGPVRRGVTRLHESLDGWRGQPWRLAWATALAVLYQLLRVGAGVLAGLALGLHVPLVAYLVFIPIITFLTLVPISISGLGVREAAFVYLFGLVGVSPESAFALSLILYLSILASTLPGALLQAAGATVPPDAMPRRPA